MRFALAVVVAGCAHGVTQPNAPTPPPDLGAPYAGRIVLQTAALRDRVDGFAEAWTRRLQILGATSRITYDDDRAVVDVYGAADDLERVARALANPDAARFDGRPFDGIMLDWLGPVAGCACSGRVRIVFEERFMCDFADGEHALSNRGRRAPVRTQRYWEIVGRPTLTDQQPPGPCRDETHHLHDVTVALPEGMARVDTEQLVLALGGGLLPGVPQLVSIEVAR